MGNYERAFDADWETLTEDEAVDRAYALGVAASLGEYHPDELDAIRDEMDSAYERSVVDLAFEEGKNEGREIDPPEEENGDSAVWAELVEGETVTVDPDEVATGGRDGLPEAIDKIEALERKDVDSTDVVDLPDFLDRE